MNKSIHGRGLQAITGQSGLRILVVSAIFAAVLSTAWLVGREYIMPGARDRADRYRGVVRLSPDKQGQCELFELDNNTGFMSPKGTTPCDYDITTALPSRSTDGPLGRLNGITGHFKSR